jgi:hypothetical protein
VTPLFYAIGNFISNIPWVLLISVPFWGYERIKKSYILAILAMVALLRALVGFSLISFVPNGHLWLDVYVFVHICFLLTVLYLCFRIHIAHALYTVLLMIMLGTCANSIAYIAVEPFIPDKGPFLVAEPAWWVVNALVIAITMPFVYRIFNNLLRHVLSGLPVKDILSLCIVPLTFYILASIYVVTMGAFSSMFIALIAVFAGLFLTYVQLRMVRNLRDLHTQEIKAENLLQSYERLNAHFHEINRLKHDMRNHLSMLRIYLKDNRFEDAKTYLDKYADEVGMITEAVFHENYIINTVAHDLSHRGQAIGVTVELNLKASPNNISEPDLIGLLANITDNALEACAGMSQGMNRLIKLSVTRREPYLAIVCENSYPGGIDTDKNGEGLRSNKKEAGHGYGLKTIERIASAYDGIVEYSFDENVFTITVALKDKLDSNL